MSVLWHQKSNNKVDESFAHIEFDASLISSTNCPKSVIHIMKRHSFIVLCLHNLYPSVYAYMNMRITMMMLLWHTGHVSIIATRFAQLSQKRACPQGTSANPSRGATKQTSHVISAAASAAVCGAVDVVVGVAAVDRLSSPSSSSLSLSAGCNAAV